MIEYSFDTGKRYMQSFTEQKNFYRENGYLIIPGLFQTQEIEAIRQEAIDIFKTQLFQMGFIDNLEVDEATFQEKLYHFFEVDFEKFVFCSQQIQSLFSIFRLVSDQRIIHHLNALGLEKPHISTRPLLVFKQRKLAKKEHFWRIFPHQDWRSMQGSLDSMVVWIPMMEVSRLNGTLEIIPGSHLKGLIATEMIDSFGQVPEAYYEESEFVPVEIKAGDALFLSSFLIHRAGDNQTDNIRWAMHFRYNNLKETTFVERGFPYPYAYSTLPDLIYPGFPESERVRLLFEEQKE